MENKIAMTPSKAAIDQATELFEALERLRVKIPSQLTPVEFLPPSIVFDITGRMGFEKLLAEHIQTACEQYTADLQATLEYAEERYRRAESELEKQIQYAGTLCDKLAEKSRWIPVEERLPEVEEEVDSWHPIFGREIMHVDTMRHDSGIELKAWKTKRGWRVGPTHWKSLSAPPQAQGEKS